MKSITINGSKRESVGKKSTKALRNAGQVPCVIYGGDTPMHFSAPELAFSKLVYTSKAHTVVVALDSGEKLEAVLQDIQFHPVTDRILHIDFYQLFSDKPIAMNIPVNIIGQSIGVKMGGNLQKNQRKLRIKALPTNLPDFIEIDITDLKIGERVYLREILNDSYSFLQPESTVVCQIRRARAALVEATLEGEGEDSEEGTDTTEAATEATAEKPAE
jgi:large subunit ribosomal protein L25